MKVKRAILMITLVISLILGLTACDEAKSTINKDKSAKEAVNVDKEKEKYEVISKTYNKNSTKITYPEIKSLDDKEKLKTINKILEETALNIINDYIKDDPTLKDITLDINYDVKFKNEKYLSVVYSGYRHLKDGPYPTSVFYTTNIDIEKGENLRLSDYINIKDMLKKLKSPKAVKAVSVSDNSEVLNLQKDYLLSIEDEELLSILKEADFYKESGKLITPTKGSYSYMEGDNIVISLELSHAIGDHGEFAVKK